jgi:hypothetical protein
MRLLYVAGTGGLQNTGFWINPNGTLNFVPSQTFPGTGTITGITTASPLTGSGASGSVGLGLNTAALETTLNSQYAQLGAGNTFTQNQTMNAGLTVLGTASANLVNSTTGYQLNGTPFDSGDSGNGNASLGFATPAAQGATGSVGVGPSALGLNGGQDNTAVGDLALSALGSGMSNTAVGYSALNSGADFGNTGVGANAGESNGPSESNDTFIGYGTGLGGGTGNIDNATAIGANAVVDQDNSLILGGKGSNAVTVGIGTDIPFSDYALDVEAVSNSQIDSGVVVNVSNGNIYLGMTNGVHKFRVDVNGKVYADGGSVTSGADFAESVAVRGSRSKYEPGDLLAIDTVGPRRLVLARTPYSTLVAGIYSTKPGVLATPHDIDDPRPTTTEVPLAVMGIVPCKATAENGPIRLGDLLVTSSRAGYAMRGTDRRKMLGAVVGKALQPLANGTGVIQVLVTLQ